MADLAPPVEQWLTDLGFTEQERIGQSRVFTRGAIRVSVSSVVPEAAYLHAGHIGQEQYTLRYVDLPGTPDALRVLLGAIGRIEDGQIPELPAPRAYREHRDYPPTYDPAPAAATLWEEIRRHGPDLSQAAIRKIEEALHAAYAAGAQHLYIFSPLVHAPWGEMQVYVTVRSGSFFDAQRDAVWELRDWQRSQVSLGRADFPWLEEAIQKIEAATGAAFTGHGQFDRNKVAVLWYDEREPL